MSRLNLSSLNTGCFQPADLKSHYRSTFSNGHLMADNNMMEVK